MTSDFHTTVELPDYRKKTGYRAPALFMGSCFTENIGNSMQAFRYPVDVNPFGILYNPVSVANGLHFLTIHKNFTETDLIHNAGLWHSFYHHGRFSSADSAVTLEMINQRINHSSTFLKKAAVLFITFGTAWVYELKSTGMVVSNCHKIPDTAFRRYRMGTGEIAAQYKKLLPQVWQINPDLHIIFTVSPVRHWKDGAVENQRSKSTLILATEEIISHFGKERCSYFPAYEIMMDELRDYRYYDEDMIHLSSSAITHIWKIFNHHLIDEESRGISKKIQKVISSLNHIPFNPFTKEHLSFLQQTLQKTQLLQEKFQYLDLTNEINLLTGKITETANNKKTRSE